MNEITLPRINQLISYIAPGAPATRRRATGKEAFLRPEIGFTPKWYNQNLSIDFSRPWHSNPSLRKASIIKMRSELKNRFPESSVGQIDEPNSPMDILTGTYGACTIAGIYGIPIRFTKDNWPVSDSHYFTDNEIDTLQPPDLDNNLFFKNLIEQIEWIQKEEKQVIGFINWQGILNNAQRIRGPQLFIDFYENPARANHLFRCVYSTMVDAARRVYDKQMESGFVPDFFTVSNCLVNLISKEIYSTFLLPFDQKFAEIFGCIGIHNCAWKADPYLNSYSKISNIGYIDMGISSDLQLARKLFPHARRAIMYTPMDLNNKSIKQIQIDLKFIAEYCGPCDIVCADIDAGTADKRVLEFIRVCEEIGKNNQKPLY